MAQDRPTREALEQKSLELTNSLGTHERILYQFVEQHENRGDWGELWGRAGRPSPRQIIAKFIRDELPTAPGKS